MSASSAVRSPSRLSRGQIAAKRALRAPGDVADLDEVHLSAIWTVRECDDGGREGNDCPLRAPSARIQSHSPLSRRCGVGTTTAVIQPLERETECSTRQPSDASHARGRWLEPSRAHARLALEPDRPSPACTRCSSASRRFTRAAVGGWVQNGRPSLERSLPTMHSTARAWAWRRSARGIRSLRRSSFTRAAASALGRPVRAAAAASAANSRVRDMWSTDSRDTQPNTNAGGALRAARIANQRAIPGNGMLEDVPYPGSEPRSADARVAQEHSARGRAHVHHRGVPVRNMGELMGQDGLELGSVEPRQQLPGEMNAAARRPRVRLDAQLDDELGNRDVGAHAQPLEQVGRSRRREEPIEILRPVARRVHQHPEGDEQQPPRRSRASPNPRSPPEPRPPRRGAPARIQPSSRWRSAGAGSGRPPCPPSAAATPPRSLCSAAQRARWRRGRSHRARSCRAPMRAPRRLRGPRPRPFRPRAAGFRSRTSASRSGTRGLHAWRVVRGGAPSLN